MIQQSLKLLSGPDAGKSICFSCQQIWIVEDHQGDIEIRDSGSAECRKSGLLSKSDSGWRFESKTGSGWIVDGAAAKNSRPLKLKCGSIIRLSVMGPDIQFSLGTSASESSENNRISESVRSLEDVNVLEVVDIEEVLDGPMIIAATEDDGLESGFESVTGSNGNATAKILALVMIGAVALASLVVVVWAAWPRSSAPRSDEKAETTQEKDDSPFSITVAKKQDQTANEETNVDPSKTSIADQQSEGQSR